MSDTFSHLLRKPSHRARRRAWAEGFAIIAMAACFTFYAMTPTAPGRSWLAEKASQVTASISLQVVGLKQAATPTTQPDQHFKTCRSARAAGRENIPAWDPSYRKWLDRDGDGKACEPYDDGGTY